MMPTERILIVEDERVLRQSLKIGLQDQGFLVAESGSGETALDQVRTFMPSIVLLDIRLPGIDGLEVLKKIQIWDEELPVIIMTAYGDTQTTVMAIKQGAFNFIKKPFELDELNKLIHQALESRTLRREVAFLRYQQRRFYRFCDLVGESRQMKEIFDQIDVVAQTEDSTILIRGESGTGKELVASAIHFKSKRSKAPFVEINCASLPEGLLESELFGYEKGAFTDAQQLKKGLFELSDGGTIFLDEVGEIPLSIQAKLLRVLEKKRFKRLGSGRDIEVDVRIISATNKNLEKAIEDKSFREDLYYRLNVIPLYMPPLRERKEDILLLANYFLEQFCRDMGKAPKTLSPEVTDIFNTYYWRGNVRELRNVIERAIIFSKGRTINKNLLPPEIIEGNKETVDHRETMQIQSSGRTLEENLAIIEDRLIGDALQKADGNKTRAAKLLGISRFALNRRLERLQCHNLNGNRKQ